MPPDHRKWRALVWYNVCAALVTATVGAFLIYSAVKASDDRDEAVRTIMYKLEVIDNQLPTCPPCPPEKEKP